MEGIQEVLKKSSNIVRIRGLIIADDTMKTHWLGKHPNTVSFSSFLGRNMRCWCINESMNQKRSRQKQEARRWQGSGTWRILLGVSFWDSKNSWIDQLMMTWEYYFYVHMKLYGCYLHVHVSATSWREMIVSTILGFWWNLKKTKHIWERPCDDSWVYKEEYLTSASTWHCNDLCLLECPMRFLIRRAVRCTPLATLLYWYVAAGGPSC